MHDKCSMLEQKAISMDDFQEWEQHASGCSSCAARLRIMKALRADSDGLHLHLDSVNVAGLEDAISARRTGVSRILNFKFAYAGMFLALAATLFAAFLVLRPCSKTDNACLNGAGKLSWEASISARDISRRIDSALRARRDDSHGRNSVGKEAESLRRKMIELKKSMEDV